MLAPLWRGGSARHLLLLSLPGGVAGGPGLPSSLQPACEAAGQTGRLSAQQTDWLPPAPQTGSQWAAVQGGERGELVQDHLQASHSLNLPPGQVGWRGTIFQFYHGYITYIYMEIFQYSHGNISSPIWKYFSTHMEIF